MVEEDRYSLSVHVHFKRKTTSAAALARFFEPLEKFVAKEARGVAGLAVQERKGAIIPKVSSKNASFNLRASSSYFDMRLLGERSESDIKRFDPLINKVLNYVNASEVGVGATYTEFERRATLKSNPLDMFTREEVLADFSTSSKQSFVVSGLSLRSEREDGELSVSFGRQDEKTHMAVAWDITSEKTLPQDIFRTSDRKVQEYMPILVRVLEGLK